MSVFDHDHDCQAMALFCDNFWVRLAVYAAKEGLQDALFVSICLREQERAQWRSIKVETERGEGAVVERRPVSWRDEILFSDCFTVCSKHRAYFL